MSNRLLPLALVAVLIALGLLLRDEEVAAPPGEPDTPLSSRQEASPPNPAPGLVEPPPGPIRIYGSAHVRGQIVLPPHTELTHRWTIDLVPLADASLPVRRAEGDADSLHFEFEGLPFGHYGITARSSGFEPTELALALNEGNAQMHLLMPMKSEIAIVGVALTQEGRPAVGLPVTAVGLPEIGEQGLMQTATAVTNEDGAFRIAGLEQRGYRVQPGEPRNPIGTQQQVYLAGDEAWVDISLPPVGRIEVTVYDRENDGAVLADTPLRAVSRTNTVLLATTGEDGVALFQHVPLGVWQVSISGIHHERAHANLLVENDRTSNLDLRTVRAH